MLVLQESTAMIRRVVITGLSVKSPLGNTVEDFWNGLTAGRSGTRSLYELASWRLFQEFEDEFASRVIADVRDFERDIALLPFNVRRRDRYIQLAVSAGLDALNDAGIQRGSFDPDRLGIALATSIGGAHATDVAFCLLTRDGTSTFAPQRTPQGFYQDCTFNTPSILLAQHIGSEGPCITLSTACVSGIDVLGTAYEAIFSAKTDMMLVGASEAPITPARFAGYDVIRCISRKHNQHPEQASRPFDRDRDGFVLGEGAGVLMLEEREHALARHAHIYAEISGFGLTTNAQYIVSLRPVGSSNLARAMKQALEQAHIAPHDVQCIYADGSSTQQNDEFETLAIKEVFGDRATTIPVTGIKSMLGHPLAAAGAHVAVAAALTLDRGKIPPTINYETRDARCDLALVAPRARDFSDGVVLLIGNGFSGVYGAVSLIAA